MRKVIVIILCFISILANGQYNIQGQVFNEEGEWLTAAAVYLKGTQIGTTTDERGNYFLTDIEEGEYQIVASFLGYQDVEKDIVINENKELNFRLLGSIFNLDEIEINGTWVKRNMPFSYKNQEAEEIENLNLGQDVPYLLRFTPSLVVTSDAGAGVGYTGMRIRGSDPSRINVTINGIPLNDSESQLVFWVDLPDFASSTEEIQIQRGVGPSTNGTSAFGATINLNTNKVRVNPYLTLSSSYGSFNTSKINVQGGTGLMNNRFSIDARYSLINSDGYVDRASSRLQSFFASGKFIQENASLTLNLFQGSEVTYQAWNGLPYQYLDFNRTFNTAGTQKSGDPYSNEVDDYDQTHLQLHYNRSLNENLILNASAHYTRGFGFFENYQPSVDPNSFGIQDNTKLVYDLITRRYLDNHFYGGFFELEWSDLEERNNVTFGTSVNQYLGGHYGRLLQNPDEFEGLEYPLGEMSYYENDAIKLDYNSFIKWSFRPTNRLLTYLDLQYRRVDYDFEGFDADANVVDQNVNHNFFNPKAGLSYLLDTDSKLYLSYGIANREPNRNDYTESSINSRPKAERLQDLEIGYNINTDIFYANVNVYNMQYKDQLVLTGAINDVGEYTRTNVEDSYRRGMELDAGIHDLRGIHFMVNTTLSNNKIRSFTEYIDDWANGGQLEIQHELTDLAFSPSLIVGSEIGYRFLRNINNHDLQLKLLGKYVGKQYIDNTSNDFASLDPYYYLDLNVNYRLSGMKFFKELSVNFNLHNLTNFLYVSNAWVYRFYSPGYNPVPDDPYARSEGQDQYNLTGLYPQAGRYGLLGLTISF